MIRSEERDLTKFEMAKYVVKFYFTHLNQNLCIFVSLACNSYVLIGSNPEQQKAWNFMKVNSKLLRF